MFGLTLDNKERPERTVDAPFSLTDLGIAFGLFVIAFSLRLQGPVTAAVDETIIYAEMINLRRFPETKFWETSTTANPFFIHWLVYLTSSQLRSFIDSFVFEKGVTALFASLSIPIWYYAVKFLCGRRIATTAAFLLSVFGWHWVNSRFIYVYPYELTTIALATLCSVLAFGGGSFFAAVGVGLLWTFAILAKKISILAIPFSTYLFLDFLVLRPAVPRRRVFGAFLLCVATFLMTYLPFLYADGDLQSHMSSSDRFFRYYQAIEARRARLATMGLTPLGAYQLITVDAIYQLFVSSSDAFRHYFRPAGPLLDPALAVVGVLGFAYSIIFFIQRRESRIALVGLALFTLPMILSFPLDSVDQRGVARRMVGNTFFIVLVGALGSECLNRIIPRRLPRWLLPAALCITSAAMNFHYYEKEYLTQQSAVWFTDHGLRRAALILNARRSTQEGITTLVLGDQTYNLGDADQILPGVQFLSSSPELRNAIEGIKSGTVRVFIPGASDDYNFPVDTVVKELADIIPPQAWTPGPTSPRGYPLIVAATFNRQP